jgi:hypothetical protein
LSAPGILASHREEAEMDETRGMRGVRRRLERWRRSHGGPGRRIPEEFWQMAVGLARVEGVESTARALRLDAGRLGERVGALPETGTTPMAPLEYIEIGASEVGLTRRGTSIEVVTAGGGQLRIEVEGVVDVPAVVRAFVERGS